MRTASIALIIVAALIVLSTSSRGPAAAPVGAAPQGGSPPTVTQHLTISAQHLVGQQPGCIARFPVVDGTCRDWVAPVHLPDGSVISRVDVVYEDNSPTGQAVVVPARSPLDGSEDAGIGIEFITSGDPDTPGKQHDFATGEATIDNDSFHYHLEVDLDNADTKFYSAVITYQSPLPGITGPMSAAQSLSGGLAEHSLMLAASGFIAKSDDCPPISDWSGVSGADGCQEWETPIHLPDGAFVKQVEMVYDDHSSGFITATVIQTNLEGTTYEQFGPYRVDSEDTSGTTFTVLTGSPTIDNTKYAYHLRVQVPDADSTFFNARLAYTPPPANADINCSGTITLGDAIGIARYLVSLPVDQEDGCPQIGVAPAAAQNSPQGAAVQQHLVINSTEVVGKAAGCPATGIVFGVNGENCAAWAAPIHLPDCSVILSVEAYYSDGENPGRVIVSVNYGHLEGNADILSPFEILSDPGTGVQNKQETGSLTIDNAEHSYYLFVQTPASDTIFYSALITYDANVELFPAALGDVDGNEDVSLGDAIAIARYLVGLTDSAPVEC